MSGFSVQVIGLDKALATLDPEKWTRGLRRGLLKVGQRAADEVKADISPHHYTGRAEQQVHAQEEHGARVSVYVGASAALVPELRPMVEGWKSNSGKMPPIGPIAEWLAHKPNITGRPDLHKLNAKGRLTFTTFGRMVSSGKTVRGSIRSTVADSGIRSHAFLIARAIGKKGYSFGKTDSFRTAWERVRGNASQTIAAEIAQELGHG